MASDGADAEQIEDFDEFAEKDYLELTLMIKDFDFEERLKIMKQVQSLCLKSSPSFCILVHFKLAKMLLKRGEMVDESTIDGLSKASAALW
mmetsp:Transcript_4872/g.6458  ORF Transcript_4872/g.6458 Transcript_4872/m.6458 type:complete len:91 (+) Transcript_4872:213-485(+)|eukprot:CAMPEP_0185572290 /NCGR_PEP_ID=MMETSP0434-20130131/4246_1 /TAXON_ID=626734 ORGANISM="Favella taraikaensis, Strain Fe Narragansett Bay" /NCGR_SAMPLE_ID=MMETSP0434 /ASSEMBLY_ACC=CAM_ASM_000379 /LENGTH=90 /DNA_ID=CAMNT_0028188107 /DNA_START=198 /DNA_END=470 /DNA_ORIENTATION=+